MASRSACAEASAGNGVALRRVGHRASRAKVVSRSSLRSSGSRSQSRGSPLALAASSKPRLLQQLGVQAELDALEHELEEVAVELRADAIGDPGRVDVDRRGQGRRDGAGLPARARTAGERDEQERDGESDSDRHGVAPRWGDGPLGAAA